MEVSIGCTLRHPLVNIHCNIDLKSVFTVRIIIRLIGTMSKTVASYCSYKAVLLTLLFLSKPDKLISSKL